MKICLIGPTAPYRGGIAHHNNLLVRSLRDRGHTVDAITFQRQYPSFLYPGRFQEEEGPEFSDIQAERLLDSMNPISWAKVGRLLKKREYDAYLTRFWIPLFGPMLSRIQRHVGGGVSGGHVATIVDNLFPHEKRLGDRFFTQLQFRYCNGVITQSGTVSKQIAQEFPQVPETMIPHPVYEHFGEVRDQSEARVIVGEGPGPLLLFFGFIRKYKGLDLLLEALPEIRRKSPDVRLLVVGEYFGDEEFYREIIERLGLEEVVRVVDRYIPNEEVGDWFSAADLLVLPYRSATNSGIVQIGYNFAIPSIVTDVGSLSEVVIDGKTGRVIAEPTPELLADAVASILSPGERQSLAAAIVEERKRYSWPVFAERVEEFLIETFDIRD